MILNNSILLITGGTGSFGNAVLKKFLNTGVKEIRIFSRDEKKQHDMRLNFKNAKVKFIIGDVRDYESINSAMINADYVFHAAALKQVPSCEFHPIEAVKTNVIGTENVLTAAINANVKKVICLSTDKAVYPINAMGISKAMMEKVFVAKSRQGGNSTVICGTRYGNVMASRGSVIPLFVELIHENKELTLTDPNMTRFMMTLDDAVDLVLYAFSNGKPGDIFVKKAPAATLDIMTQALCELMGEVDYPTRIIGTRHGEKRYESLLSKEEMAYAIDKGNYYRIPPDLRDLNYAKYIDLGEKSITNAREYSSDNTKQLDVKGMKILLNKLRFIQETAMGEIIEPEE